MSQSIHSGPLPFKRLTPGATAPRKAYRWDGAFDLFADAPAIVGASASVVSTGIAVAIPPGFVGQLWGRSKLASKGVSPLGFLMLEEDGTIRLGGMIDAGYRFPLLVLMATIGPVDGHRINPGDAVCQLCVVPIPDLTPLDVGDGDLPPPPDDRPGGFGTSDPAPPIPVGLDEEALRRALIPPAEYIRAMREYHAAHPERFGATSGYVHVERPPAPPPAPGVNSGAFYPSQQGLTAPPERPGPRAGAGKIISAYAELGSAPPRQESPPQRGSAHYEMAERMDRSIPDYPSGAAPYSALPAPAPPTAPVRPVAPLQADPRPNPPAEPDGLPPGLREAVAQWDAKLAPFLNPTAPQAPTSPVARSVVHTPSGPVITESWNGPFVDTIPREAFRFDANAPTGAVAPPPAPRPSDTHAAAGEPPTDAQSAFWNWWGRRT